MSSGVRSYRSNAIWAPSAFVIRVHDDVDGVELLALLRVREQELRELQDVRGRRDLVRVLARGVDDGGLERRRFVVGEMRGVEGGHEVHGPDVLPEVALAHLVDRRFGALRHVGENAVGLRRGYRRVPLDELVLGRGRRASKGLDVGERRRRAVCGELRQHLAVPVDLVLPASPHHEVAEPMVGECLRVVARRAQCAEVVDHAGRLLGGEDALVDLLGARELDQLVAPVRLGVHLQPDLEPGESVDAGRDAGAESSRPVDRDLRDIASGGARRAVRLHVIDDDGGAARLEPRETDRGAPGLAVGLGLP